MTRREEPIALRLLGPMAVLRGGAPVPLPASRKTRALLAYLAISGKPERRERLCDLLWEVPDDPRGALRWSLSKLRGLLGEGCVEAGADAVALTLPDEAVDWRRLRALVLTGPRSASTEALQRAAEAGALLEGLELPRCDRFQAWCAAQREDVRQWRAAVLAELSGRPIAPDAALAHARLWVELDGDSPAAWQRLVELLQRSGRTREAEEQRALGAGRLGAAGSVVPPALRRSSAPSPPHPAQTPDVRFCTSADGTGLAYAVTGEGPAIVKVANWATHIERDAASPVWRHWIAEFSHQRRLLLYDQRGNGLSDRKAPIGFDAFVSDLEAVADAAGFDRFDLLGLSHGASVALAYAVRRPERVRRLVVLGGFAQGWAVRASPEEAARREAMATLARQGWDLDNPAFRQMFTSLFLPDGTPQEQAWFNEAQRLATSPENAAAFQLQTASTDVQALLARVTAPTLVAHCRDDAMVPFEAGRALARAIPGARFLALEGRNHVLLESDPAWPRFAAAARAFLDL